MNYLKNRYYWFMWKVKRRAFPWEMSKDSGFVLTAENIDRVIKILKRANDNKT